MARTKKKITKTQKEKMNPHGSGQSRYAMKLARRKRAARDLGLPESSSWPVIWAYQDRLI